MRVKSLNTGPRHLSPTCSCKNWLEHWDVNRYPENNKFAGFCRACQVTFKHSDLVGGHVIKVNSTDSKRYIVPLCYSCNNKNPFEFEVDLADLISANCDDCVTKK